MYGYAFGMRWDTQIGDDLPVLLAGDDESGPIEVSVRRILSAEPANVTYAHP